MKKFPARYPSTFIWLHGLMALLILAAFVAIELHEWFPRGSSLRQGFKTAHFYLGISIFGLVLLRLVWRSRIRLAPVEPAPRLWQARAAQAGHLAIYALLVIMPLLGMSVLALEGKPLQWGAWPLPWPMAPSADLAETLESLHETIGQALLALLLVHTLAALYHHMCLRDTSFQRMFPWVVPRPKRDAP
jgi:superoxide oxidase